VVGYDSDDFIKGRDVGEKVSYGLETLSTDFDDDYGVVAVAVTARAYKGTSDSEALKLLVRSGAADELGASHSIDATSQPYQTVFSSDPNISGSTDWGIAAAKAIEIGIETQ